MNKVQLRSKLLVTFVLLLMLMFAPDKAEAQWPPFRFFLVPSFADGKITYNVTLLGRFNKLPSNVAIKIPIPEGTRFVEADAQATTSVTFDGQEVTFFTATFTRALRQASFVVEVTDPDKIFYFAQAWIAWEGPEPGDYLAPEIGMDISRKPLNWSQPFSVLELDAKATTADDTITYDIYLENIGWRRMWDLKINVPIPEGATFVSAETTAPFVTNFDGREVSFFATEIARLVDIGPLSFKVSTEGVTDPVLVTHAWATWKNAALDVGRKVAAQEATRSGDIVVRPSIRQDVVTDDIGDVPFSNYDITSVAVGEVGDLFEIGFYGSEEAWPVGVEANLNFYFDQDCNTETGEERRGVGTEFRARYTNETGEGLFFEWDPAIEDWNEVGPLEFSRSADGRVVFLWVPNEFVNVGEQLCWTANSWYGSSDFFPSPPLDYIPNESSLTLTRRDVQTPISSDGSSAPTYSADDIFTSSVVGATSASTVARSVSELSGKLAIPIDNGHDQYNVHIFSVPDGQEVNRVWGARQPDFRADGQKLLVNHEGNGVENVFEFNLADQTEIPVSDAPEDSHPFYDPWGNRIVYGNSALTIGSDKKRNPYIYVQCGIKPPHLETDYRCKEIPTFGILVPAGQISEIQGSNPVWMANNQIAYKGCNSWAGFASCGIYTVDSGSTRGFSPGTIPRQLTRHPSDIPTDTKDNRIVYMSRQDGNWEVYTLQDWGDSVTIGNLSNSPDSQDGLPAISPDGNWVAFVSDRGGQWAVWVTHVEGKTTEKLFDLPAAPWGNGARGWTTERISWGP